MNYLSLSVGGETIQKPPNIPSSTEFGNIVGNSLSILIGIAVFASFIFIILGGISWITSGGDKQKLEKARGTIVFAIIGLIISISAFTIIHFLGRILNVPSLVIFGT